MMGGFSAWKYGLVISLGATNQSETACGFCHELTSELWPLSLYSNQRLLTLAELNSQAGLNAGMNQ